MKNILLIASRFPPELSAGAGRPFSIYKYLPQFGYQVTVLTKDYDSISQNEDNIVRAASFANWRNSSVFSEKYIVRIFSLLREIFLGNVVYQDKLWIKYSIKKADELISKKHFDFVYASFPETDSLTIGLEINRKYKIPLISEFRDGLLFEPLADMNFVAKRIATKLERSVIQQSTAIITIGNRITEYFRKTYPTVHSYTVYNGYDAADFIDLKDVKFNRENKKIKILNFGSLGMTKANVNRRNYFVAIQRLKKQGLLTPDNFEMSLIGSYTAKERKMLGDLDIEDLVMIYAPMSKKNGFLKIKQEYDYLLFYGCEGFTSIISSKLLEYINLGKPIIGICKGNEAEEVIEMTKTGEIFDYDVDSIETALKKALANEISFAPIAETISSFSRETQASQIADIINKHCIV